MLRLLDRIPGRYALLTLGLYAVVGAMLDNYFLYLVSLVGVYVIFAIGYNLLMGFTGQFDFGQAAFLAIGAYSTAIIQTKLNFPFPFSLLLGAIISVSFGLIIGFVVLRLAGFYLALVTIAFNYTIVLVLSLWNDVTGGFQGTAVPRPEILGISDNLLMFYIIALTTVILVQTARSIVDSRLGKAFMAIRENEIAAEAVGINLTRYRVMAYGISAFYGGIAGGLLGALLSYITPEGFVIFETIRVLTMNVVGGMGSIIGSIIGASVLILSSELLRFSKVFQEVAYGALLFFFVLLMPKGIYGMIVELHKRIQGKIGARTK